MERAFKDVTAADAPNVVAATPTLEMGIDIGDLSAVMLTSIPPGPASYGQRVGRAGRKTGNALITAFVRTDSHGLYYLSDPDAMISGDVRPPNCYLVALDILKRQFLAFLIDRVADLSIDAASMPREIGMLMKDGLNTGSLLGQLVDTSTLDPAHIESFLSLFADRLAVGTREAPRAAAPVGADDLFIVGDSHQRIYDRRSSLSKVGINIVGRSYKLRINYRTTHEILGWALTLLGEGDFDDLDLGPDHHDFAGYHSFLHGDPPEISANRSKREQYEALARRVRDWVAQGVAPEDIGIAVRGASAIEPIRNAVRAGAAEEVVTLDQTLESGDGVRIGTMHRMKGLEFRCVAIADVDDDTVPSQHALTDRHADEISAAGAPARGWGSIGAERSPWRGPDGGV